MIYALILSFLWIGPSGGSQTPAPKAVTEDSLFIRVMNYDQLRPMLHQDNDTTYVVNFWATWCVPCMEELPYMLALDSVYRNYPMKLLLVSLDFKKDYIRKLQPLVRKKKLEDNVVVLEDNDANFWINDIDPKWGGAIPATLVYKGKERTFYERSFHELEDLKAIVKPYLNL
ncbi:MAG TPA: thioredoxin domain-containing protein [Saprospiraceae bacterium]|nr:thioredoxin domain-containing protein [Saprospiraceae bacterium]